MEGSGSGGPDELKVDIKVQDGVETPGGLRFTLP